MREEKNSGCDAATEYIQQNHAHGKRSHFRRVRVEKAGSIFTQFIFG